MANPESAPSIRISLSKKDKNGVITDERIMTPSCMLRLLCLSLLCMLLLLGIADRMAYILGDSVIYSAVSRRSFLPASLRFKSASLQASSFSLLSPSFADLPPKEAIYHGQSSLPSSSERALHFT